MSRSPVRSPSAALVQAAAAAQRRAGDAGARRQVAATGLRRRRPRRRAARSWSMPASRMPARPARPARASWSQRASMTKWSTRLAERYGALRAGPARRRPRPRPADLRRSSATRRRRSSSAAGRRRAGRWRAARSSPTRPAGGHYLAPGPARPAMPPDHGIAQDEIFGPVQVVHPVRRRGRGRRHRQRHRLTASSPASGPAMAAARCGSRKRAAAGPGVPQQLRCGRRRRAALRRRTGQSGHGREKGMEALYGFTVLKTVAAWHG